MAKISYVPKKFNPQHEKIIIQANTIIEEYQAQGFELTLRQLYYQFVARDIIPNTQREYKNLGSVISDGRLAGEIDWDAIVDRTRNLMGTTHYNGPGHRLRSAARSFAIDKWEGQKYRPEVWIEKDALVGVIERVCARNDVDYFSCRGYTSQSEMHSAAKRLEEYVQSGQTPLIIHLGDHDPSGIDMTRDIFDRMELFMGGCEVKRIALNMNQVEKYSPPPNPAKVTDPRAKPYIKLHGHESWELDALDPKVIDKMIDVTIRKHRDDRQWEERVELEKTQRQKIEAAAGEIDED